MTIDEAIKILEPIYHDFMPSPNPQTIKAVRLGVEALKLVKNLQWNKGRRSAFWIKGQTENEKQGKKD